MDEHMNDYKKELEQQVYEGLHARYGAAPDREITDRIERELAVIKASDISIHFAAFRGLALFLKSKNIPYLPIFATSSAFVFYLLGVTFANPLPPHYYCPNCHCFLWDDSCKDGFDLPPRRCPCGLDYVGDGHDLPAESYWKDILLEKWLWPVAYGDFCIRIPKSTGQIVFDYIAHHPSQDVFTPIEHYDDNKDDYPYRDHRFGDLLLQTGDDLPDESASFYEQMPSEKIKQSLLEHMEITDIMDNSYSKLDEVLSVEYIPKTFYGLIKAFGICNSSTKWNKDDRDTILSSGTVALDGFPAHREDFYELLGNKLTRQEIWKESERIRKGKGMSPHIAELVEAKWLVDYINGIQYLPPKAQIVELLIAKAKLRAIEVSR